MSTTTDKRPARTERLARLLTDATADGSRLVATIMQAPGDTYGNVLRGVVVYAIPEPRPGTHRTPYPVPVAAASGHFMEGRQLVTFALTAQVVDGYPGTSTMEEFEMVGDRVSILPTHYVKRQRDVTEAVEHAARAISQREE